MVISEAQEIKKQEVLVRFSIISYKTRLSVVSGSWLGKVEIEITQPFLHACIPIWFYQKKPKWATNRDTKMTY